MATQTPNELLDWLVDNQFLSETRAQPFRSPPASYNDTRTLVRDLIQRNWLTPYQVNQILQDRGKELVLGPYRLLERIGEGAMGQVFKAWNPKLERLIAIKMIHKEHLASKKAMDRFRREMETASHLDHPNIVLVRDADEVDSRPYLVMDYVDGTDLSHLVKQGGPLQVWEGAEYVRQAALGLQHAYERGVIHRDIKPGNLLLTNDGVVKILDFGLARFENITGQDNRLTQFGSVLGTVDYIAPEQAENAQAADIRADIYSLGCSLFFILAGKAPFPGSTIVERVSARMVGGPPSIRAIRPDVPPAFEAVLQKMMARNIADRYQTPAEVAAALQPFCDKNLAAVPILADPVLVAAPADMPRAQPVGQPGSGAATASAHNPFAFSFSDVVEPPPRPAVPTLAPPAAAAVPAWKAFLADKQNFYLVIGGGGLLLVLLTLFLTRGCGSAATKKYAADASLALSLKENVLYFDLRDSSVNPRKNLIVTVNRHKFSGKVRVYVDKPPKGVRIDSMTLGDNEGTGELPVLVNYWTKSMEKAPLKVVATSEHLVDETTFYLTIKGRN